MNGIAPVAARCEGRVQPLLADRAEEHYLTHGFK
jgi:hypothetical protein